MTKETVLASILLWSTFVEGKVPADFKDVSEIPGVKIDLRYATINNFTGQNLYGEFKKAFLHKLAFEKLKKAQEYLDKNHPGYGLLILDALRPRAVQRVLFSHVKGTDQESYVADPDKGSVHNYGMAVDLTLLGPEGKEIDMGTPFDDFTDLAQPRYEEKFLYMGKLSSEQIKNRKILRDAMIHAGFSGIPNEWWHFNALPIKEVKSQYKVVE